MKEEVAIPSNRVNVSYIARHGNTQSNSASLLVAIPSNRVNVSYVSAIEIIRTLKNLSRNPLKSGQCFLQMKKSEKKSKEK